MSTCKHGQLARSCETCELEQESQVLREALQALLKWMPIYPASADCISGGRQRYEQVIAAARAALAKGGV